MTSASLESLIQKVGGDRNATVLVGVGGAGLVWFIGRRKRAKAQQAQPVNVMAQGYGDTAQDPTQLYTGYDQLQQEITDLRGQLPGQGSGIPNQNPAPPPVSPGSPPPVAPIPLPPPALRPIGSVSQDFWSGFGQQARRGPAPTPISVR